MPWAVRRRSPTRSSIGAPITCWCSTQQGVPGGEGMLRAALFRPRRHGQAGVRRLRRQSPGPPARLRLPTSLEALRAWPGLRTVLAVETIRSVTGSGKVEIRYFLSSCGDDVKVLVQAIRRHIENGLHLDVTFREDDSRVRGGPQSGHS